MNNNFNFSFGESNGGNSNNRRVNDILSSIFSGNSGMTNLLNLNNFSNSGNNVYTNVYSNNNGSNNNVSNNNYEEENLEQIQYDQNVKRLKNEVYKSLVRSKYCEYIMKDKKDPKRSVSEYILYLKA